MSDEFFGYTCVIERGRPPRLYKWTSRERYELISALPEPVPDDERRVAVYHNDEWWFGLAPNRKAFSGTQIRVLARGKMKDMLPLFEGYIGMHTK